MQITYKDKVTLQSNPNIPDENKVTAKDMNEIKSVVNSNEEEQQDLTLSVQEIAQNVVNNSQEISNIKEEQTTQNDNIQTNSNNISDLQSNKADKNEIPTDLSQLSNDNTKFVNETGLENAISQEKTQRQNADNNLQNQVDTNKTNIQTNATNIATNTQEINTIKAEQTTQNNRLNNLETDNTTNKDNISANTQEINNIKSEQTTQNTNISTNATNIESLQEENENLKKIVSQLPQVTGQGTEVTLENTIEATFTKFDVEGNSVQDGTPSPDNEQPIYSAGDNENLFDIGTSIDDYYHNNVIIELKEKEIRIKVAASGLTYSYRLQNFAGKKQYAISAKASNQYGRIFIRLRNNEDTAWLTSNDVSIKGWSYNSTYTGWYKDFNSTSINTIIEIPECLYWQFGFGFSSIEAYVGTIQTISNIKIEKSNKASGYSPYGMGSINEKIKNADGTEEQDYSIFVQQPMRSIGDVRDGFAKVNRVWNEVHYIGEKDLGECTWIPVNSSENSRTQGLFTSFSVQNIENYSSSSTTIPKLLSNKYISKPNYNYQADGRNPQDYTISTFNGNILYIQNSDFSGYTNQQVKEALAGTVLQYVLKNPTYLPCTETQIQQLENKPSTYKDFTIIQSQDETPAYLEVSGIRDINTMFDKVTNAIVSLGGNV